MSSAVTVRETVFAQRPVLEADTVRQRVHQPGLAAGLRPHRRQRLRRERLAGRLRVLAQQRQRLLAREVAQPQRRGGDVERAAGGAHAVVAQVAHAGQHHAVRKALRAPGVAGAELLQHRQQRITHQRVDLVDQQYQRSRRRLRPARQRFAQGLVRTDSRQNVGPDVVQKAVIQRRPRLRRQPDEHRAHCPLYVVARGAGSFDGNVHAPVAAPVQHIGQRQQRRRLASLARRMQHEVLLVSHQPKDFVQVDALKRWNAVVLVGLDGTSGVERTHVSTLIDDAWQSALRLSVECIECIMVRRHRVTSHQGGHSVIPRLGAQTVGQVGARFSHGAEAMGFSDSACD